VLYWFLKTVGLGPWLKAIWRPYVEGAENVPETGGAILASNHLSFCDSFFMPLMVKRRVTFLAKAEYFTGCPGCSSPPPARCPSTATTPTPPRAR
jgi:1-acyl-sn-glycerol-3-phosphate acyltransferase